MQQSLSPWDHNDQTFDEFQEEEQKEQILPQADISLPRKNIKTKKLKINTSKARSELKLLKKVIYRNNWVEEHLYSDSGDIFWSGLALKDDDIYTALTMITNRFPGMRDLATKTQTGFFLNKFREYFHEDFDFFPRSFIIPDQQDEFEKYFQHNKSTKLFIAKPDAGSQGEGIFFVKQLKDLNYINKQLIIQEYIKSPLLIDNKKFDLRIYVLITSIEPYICYVNKEGLARFCTEDYEVPNSKNINNPYIHLTNYSLNKESPKFIHWTGNFLDINPGSKRTISSLMKSLSSMGINISAIEQSINDLIEQFLISLHPFLMFNFKAAFQKNASQARCFHILGFDILLDDELKPWLLEINANPSLNIDHDVLGKDGKPITVVSPLDEFVKMQVMEDAIYLVIKKPEQQLEKIGVGGEFESYKMIIGGENVDSEEKELIGKILKIYGYLSGYKFRESLTSSKFCKLANLPEMTTPTFIKNDYDLLFRKVLISQQSQFMDFPHFIILIEKLTEKLLGTVYDPNNKFPAVSQFVNKVVSHIN